MFFLFILIILLFSFLAIHTSRLEIEIKNLDIDTQREKGDKINKNYKITLYILIFKHIKIFKKNLRKKIKEQEKVKIENNIKTDYKEILKNIKIKISSKSVKSKNGKRGIKISWSVTGDKNLDGVEIFRSEKKNSGYGKKAFRTLLR